MDEQELIKKLAKDLCISTMCDLETYNDCMMPEGNCSRCRRVAKDLYAAGYRKQEWISVDERLPERNGRYLTHCKIENQSLVCILYYCKIGGFNEGTITHWMPLPEAPKGGAE